MAPKNRKTKSGSALSKSGSTLSKSGSTLSKSGSTISSRGTSSRGTIGPPNTPVTTADGERSSSKVSFGSKSQLPGPQKPKAKAKKSKTPKPSISALNTCVFKCEENLRSRRKSKRSGINLPSIPESGCVRGCRRKVKVPIDDMMPPTVVKRSVRDIVIKEESAEEVAAEEKKGREREIEQCAPDCGPEMVDKIYRSELCSALCCPPNVRSETELLEEFVGNMMADVETSSAQVESCLCDEVTRWMRYFMCGCDLNKDATVQLADAVAEADSRIPGLLKALTDELRAQADKAREMPKDRKLVPEEQRVRWYVAAKALRAANFLDEAADRWRLSAALKVAADMAAAEYEEILRKQLDVMMELLQKRLEKDWQHRTRPYLVTLQSEEFFKRSSRVSL